MPAADAFIRDANAALEQDAYHAVRRNAQGEIEMLGDGDEVLITFSSAIPIYDLVSVSLVLSEMWLNVHNATERQTFNEFYSRIRVLRNEYGDALTAKHIEDMFEETKQWNDLCDREAAEEEEALQDQPVV